MYCVEDEMIHLSGNGVEGKTMSSAICRANFC